MKGDAELFVPVPVLCLAGTGYKNQTRMGVVMLKILIGIMMMFSLSAFAGDTISSDSDTPRLCKNMTESEKNLAGKCQTTDGYVYERVLKEGFGSAWKAPNGTLWSDVIAPYSQVEALNLCINNYGRLPSRAEFQYAEYHQIREVLPNLKGYRFWSSTSGPADEYAYFYYGTDGKMYYFIKSKPLYVICVTDQADE